MVILEKRQGSSYGASSKEASFLLAAISGSRPPSLGVEGRSARTGPVRNDERAVNVGMNDVVGPRSSAVNG